MAITHEDSDTMDKRLAGLAYVQEENVAKSHKRNSFWTLSILSGAKKNACPSIGKRSLQIKLLHLQGFLNSIMVFQKKLFTFSPWWPRCVLRPTHTLSLREFLVANGQPFCVHSRQVGRTKHACPHPSCLN